MFAGRAPAGVREAADRLSRLLVELDLGLLLPSSLTKLVALGDEIERLGRGLKTRAAAKVAQSEVWRTDGDRSPEDWLARQTATSKAEAGRLVDTGRKLEQLPVVAEAVTRGELSAKQAEAIAGAATADPAAERRLLDHAKTTTLRELQDECRRTRAIAEADPDAAQRRAHAKRSCRTWTDADGVTGHLHMTGPVATIARIDNAIRHRADKVFRSACDEGRREPSEAYAFDAAEQLLIAAADGTPTPAGADAKVIVRVDHSALVRGRTAAGETCEIAGVGPVPVATVREWMDDAFLAAVLTKGEEVQKVVHLGRRFTAAQRTALQWQDPICARKGCSNRLRLEYDHFEDWADTHTTRVEAAKRFCSACHRLSPSAGPSRSPMPTANAPSPHPTGPRWPGPPRLPSAPSEPGDGELRQARHPHCPTRGNGAMSPGRCHRRTCRRTERQRHEEGPCPGSPPTSGSTRRAWRQPSSTSPCSRTRRSRTSPTTARRVQDRPGPC